jgi:hypothetical protein
MAKDRKMIISPEKYFSLEDENFYCSTCNYKKHCEKTVVVKAPFEHADAKQFFPDNPYAIATMFPDIEKYRAPRLGKLAEIPVDFPKVSFVTHQKIDAHEKVLTFPLSKLSMGMEKRLTNLAKSRQCSLGLLMSDDDKSLLSWLFGKEVFQSNEQYLGVYNNEGMNIASPTYAYLQRDWTKPFREKGFEYVMSPTVSFFFNQPACSTVQNRLLSYKFIKDLVDNGFPTIPCFLYLWESDAKAFANWINKTGFSHVYFPIQMARQEVYHDYAVKQFKLIRSLLNPSVKIIVVGASTVSRIVQYHAIDKNALYMNSYIPVISSRRLIWGVKESRYSTDQFYLSDDIFMENAANFRKELAKKGIK